MILVIDSNIVFSALLKESTCRKLLLDPPCLLYAPQILLEEIEKYKTLIQERTGLSQKALEILLELVTEHIFFTEKDVYHISFPEAEELLRSVDPDDIPFLALALVLKSDGIWTENLKHFRKQEKIKIWSTKDILLHFKSQ